MGKKAKTITILNIISSSVRRLHDKYVLLLPSSRVADGKSSPMTAAACKRTGTVAASKRAYCSNVPTPLMPPLLFPWLHCALRALTPNPGLLFIRCYPGVAGPRPLSSETPCSRPCPSASCSFEAASDDAGQTCRCIEYRDPERKPPRAATMLPRRSIWTPLAAVAFVHAAKPVDDLSRYALTDVSRGGRGETPSLERNRRL